MASETLGDGARTGDVDETDAELEEGGRSAQEQGPPGITDITQTDGRTVHRSTGPAADGSGDSHSGFLRAAVDGDGPEAIEQVQYYRFLTSSPQSQLAPLMI